MLPLSHVCNVYRECLQKTRKSAIPEALRVRSNVEPAQARVSYWSGSLPVTQKKLTWVALYIGSTRLLTMGGFGIEIALSCVQNVGIDPRICTKDENTPSLIASACAI